MAEGKMKIGDWLLVGILVLLSIFITIYSVVEISRCRGRRRGYERPGYYPTEVTPASANNSIANYNSINRS